VIDLHCVPKLREGIEKITRDANITLAASASLAAPTT
jgi:hypothetical protein